MGVQFFRNNRNARDAAEKNGFFEKIEIFADTFESGFGWLPDEIAETTHVVGCATNSWFADTRCVVGGWSSMAGRWQGATLHAIHGNGPEMILPAEVAEVQCRVVCEIDPGHQPLF
ncbi:hypothetical protein Poly59_37810 [Rubripirellula reticaptiva]|uniref:Uncharacterized protein n=1 Tax=Rubripirellula reticaptiva TaxID=2528013 RepID=A0A5C6EM06_9BACT|nr:hypothetical protein Poly59_37810 [Rubripirellula reticaptiva]